MINNQYSEAIAETLDILNHTQQEDVLKISPKFMEYLKNNASQTYISNLDHTKEIKDMQLNPKTKAILAIIYKKFWCNEEEAKAFDNKIKQNELNYQLELKRKYSDNNLFKNKKENLNTSKSIAQFSSEENSLIKMKEKNFLQKILDKLKKLFE